MQFLRITDGAIDLITEFNLFSPTISLSYHLKPVIGFSHIIHKDSYYGGFRGKFLHQISTKLYKTLGHRNAVNNFLASLFQRLITRKMALDLLKHDLKKALRTIQKNITTPLQTEQVTALLSLIFDIGCNQFEQSELLKYINKNDIANTAQEFLVFNKLTFYPQRLCKIKRIKEQTFFLSKKH